MECISTEGDEGRATQGDPGQSLHIRKGWTEVLEQRNPRYTPGRMRPQNMDRPHGGGGWGDTLQTPGLTS